MPCCIFVSLYAKYFLVPIYDARQAGSKFTDVLAGINRLPRYGGDLPEGSSAVVSYTVSTFMKAGDEISSVSFNVHWIMLLALPGKFYEAR